MTDNVIPFRKPKPRPPKPSERPFVARSVDDLFPSPGFTGWGTQRITYPEQEDKD